MKRVFTLALFSSVLFALFLSSSAQSCNSFIFENNKQYQSCNILPLQSASVHWNYISSNNTVDLAYRRTSTSRSQWISWALNPGTSMAGSQCLVAFVNSSGSVSAYTSPITNNNPTLQRGDLSFQVPSISATYDGSSVMTIYATLELTSTFLKTNQIWQYGPLSSSGSPGQHLMNAENVGSIQSIDFTTGQVSSSPGGANSFSSRLKKRNVSYMTRFLFVCCKLIFDRSILMFCD